MPSFPDSTPPRSPPHQLDLFRDRPGGDMLLLLAVLEHEAFAAAARGRIRDAIRELTVLRDALGGADCDACSVPHSSPATGPRPTLPRSDLPDFK